MIWGQLGGSNSWFKMWCKIDVQLEIFNIKARDKQKNIKLHTKLIEPSFVQFKLGQDKYNLAYQK